MNEDDVTPFDFLFDGIAKVIPALAALYLFGHIVAAVTK